MSRLTDDPGPKQATIGVDVYQSTYTSTLYDIAWERKFHLYTTRVGHCLFAALGWS